MILSILRFFDKRFRDFALLFLTVFCIYFTSKAYVGSLSDFAGYYFGARMWLDGLFNVSVYFPSDFNQTIQQVYNVHTYVAYTPFPPFTAIVFSPFVFLPVVTAKLVFNCANIAMLVWMVLRMIDYLKLKTYFVLILPLIFYIPLRNNFLYGQGYILLMLLLFEGYLAFERRNRLLGSVLWSFAFLFKIFPCILIFYLLKRKDWRSIFYIGCIGGVLFGVSYLAIGKEVWQHYFSIMPRLSNGELNDPFAITFQSLFMFLKNIFVFDVIFNAYPVVNSRILFDLSWLSCQAMIFAILMLWKSDSHLEDFTEFAFWIMATLLLSPNGSTYSLLGLMFVFFALSAAEKIKNLWFYVCLIGFISNFPLHLLKGESVFFQFPRLYGLIMLFVAVFCLFQKIKFSHVLLFALVALCLFCIKFRARETDTDPGEFVVSKPNFDMAHKLLIRNDSVVMYSCLEKEWEYKSLGFRPFFAQEITVMDNQLYFHGNAITKGKDFKRSPVQIARNKVLYLSDQGHGIGFFVPKIMAFD